jgi:hypothetical protein
MKLYYVPQAPVGQRWQGTQADAKQAGRAFASDFTMREVPVDKPNLLQFLNTEELVILQQRPQGTVLLPPAGPVVGPISTHGRPPDELEAAELRAVAAVAPATTMPSPGGVLKYDYNSPFNARTVLAAIDASTCAKAVKQFHGDDLRKVVAAGIERVSELLVALPENGGRNGTQ